MAAAVAALRVLNAVREADVGLPITYPEFLRLGPQRLAMRLAGRRQHYLALQVPGVSGSVLTQLPWTY
jgi:hypothetical protein